MVIGLAGGASAPPTAPVLRVATYNIALNADAPGGVIERLQRGDADARRLAAVIQHVRPDILLLNELDFDEAGRAAELFRMNYLGVGQLRQAPINYPYFFSAPVNTGIDSGLDLDGDGALGGPGDAWGFGRHPGQYGMLVLSRYPIDTSAARTFQTLRWADLPGAVGPLHPDTGTPWYAPKIWAQLRLSSKSHWDLPIDTPLGRIHLLAAHPTPPAFDGPEQRNVVRNADEIRLWLQYLDGAGWMRDDHGREGGLADDARFVIAGDLNADPVDGSGRREIIQALLDHPRVQATPTPHSAVSPTAALTFSSDNGAALAAVEPGRDSNTGTGSDTADFGERSGQLRVDYVLPSIGFTVQRAGVFWPKRGETGSDWVTASDHRLVWVDLMPGTETQDRD